MQRTGLRRDELATLADLPQSRAERLEGLDRLAASIDAHDFY